MATKYPQEDPRLARLRRYKTGAPTVENAKKKAKPTTEDPRLAALRSFKLPEPEAPSAPVTPREIPEVELPPIHARPPRARTGPPLPESPEVSKPRSPFDPVIPAPVEFREPGIIEPTRPPLPGLPDWIEPSGPSAPPVMDPSAIEGVPPSRSTMPPLERPEAFRTPGAAPPEPAPAPPREPASPFYDPAAGLPAWLTEEEKAEEDFRFYEHEGVEPPVVTPAAPVEAPAAPVVRPPSSYDPRRLYNRLPEDPSVLNTDQTTLAPEMQDKVQQLMDGLRELGWNPTLTEALRTPARHDWIKENTPEATKIDRSVHEVGYAADILPHNGGGDVWDTNQRQWEDMRRIGTELGLKGMWDWDRGHVEMEPVEAAPVSEAWEDEEKVPVPTGAERRRANLTLKEKVKIGAQAALNAGRIATGTMPPGETGGELSSPVTGELGRAGVAMGGMMVSGVARAYEILMDDPLLKESAAPRVRFLREQAGKMEAYAEEAKKEAIERMVSQSGIDRVWAGRIAGFGDMLASGAVTSGAILATGGMAFPAMFVMGLGEIDQEAMRKGVTAEERSVIMEVGAAYIYGQIEQLGEKAPPLFAKLLKRFKRLLPQGIEKELASGVPWWKVIGKFGLWEALEEVAQESLTMGTVAIEGADQQYANAEIATRLGMAAVGGFVGSMPLGVLGSIARAGQSGSSLEDALANYYSQVGQVRTDDDYYQQLVDAAGEATDEEVKALTDAKESAAGGFPVDLGPAVDPEDRESTGMEFEGEPELDLGPEVDPQNLEPGGMRFFPEDEDEGGGPGGPGGAPTIGPQTPGVEMDPQERADAQKPLAVYTNEEDQVEATVHPHERGFSVVVQDLDSGEYLPNVRIWPTQKEAEANAQEVLGKKPTSSPAPEAETPKTEPVKETAPKEPVKVIPSTEGKKKRPKSKPLSERGERLADYIEKSTEEDSGLVSSVVGAWKPDSRAEATEAITQRIADLEGVEGEEEALANLRRGLEMLTGAAGVAPEAAPASDEAVEAPEESTAVDKAPGLTEVVEEEGTGESYAEGDYVSPTRDAVFQVEGEDPVEIPAGSPLRVVSQTQGENGEITYQVEDVEGEIFEINEKDLAPSTFGTEQIEAPPEAGRTEVLPEPKPEQIEAPKEEEDGYGNDRDKNRRKALAAATPMGSEETSGLVGKLTGELEQLRDLKATNSLMSGYIDARVSALQERKDVGNIPKDFDVDALAKEWRAKYLEEAEPVEVPKNPYLKGSPKFKGWEAFHAGVARVVPDEVTKKGAQAQRSWYAGWDRANVDAPVSTEEDTGKETPSEEPKGLLDGLSSETQEKVREPLELVTTSYGVTVDAIVEGYIKPTAKDTFTDGHWDSVTRTIRLRKGVHEKTIWHEFGHAVFEDIVKSNIGREFLADKVFGKNRAEFDSLVEGYRKKYPNESHYSDAWIAYVHSQAVGRSNESFAEGFRAGHEEFFRKKGIIYRDGEWQYEATEESGPEAEAAPTPGETEAQPWDGADVSEESKWYGTKVDVAEGRSAKLEPAYKGTVTRIFNKGALAEVYAEGKEPSQTFRIPTSRLTITKLVEYDKEVQKYDNRSGLPDTVAKAFQALGSAQRGTPELMMKVVKNNTRGNILDGPVEHVGDLTHRMTDNFIFGAYGTDFATFKDKVDKTHGYLTQRYGFSKEMLEGIKENATHQGISEETLKEKIEAALKAYAGAHRVLSLIHI